MTLPDLVTTIDHDDQQPRSLLQRIAREAMVARGLFPDFPPEVCSEVDKIQSDGREAGPQARDLRHLLWCSIDNDHSRDLDQLTVAETMPGDSVKLLVAVADVDLLVKKDSQVDRHARLNTTSVYTVAEIFPMLPERLSTDLTSLNDGSDRSALVVEMVIAADGSLQRSEVYPAQVRNRAKLAYDSVAAWLTDGGPVPEKMAAVPGLAENIRLQEGAAEQMKRLRRECGALTLETVEARPVFAGGALKDVEPEKKNRAKEMIEDFMIAANGATALFLGFKNFPSLRRVVRTPKRWDRIVVIAKEHRFALPPEPDAMALEQFLTKARAADPARFPDLSLSIIKLMGPGEYVVAVPGDQSAGHFGLATRDYTHSTAPNRRYPDLITQRLLKAAVGGGTAPYGNEEFSALARLCTEKEDAAKKVERQVRKSAAAMLLKSRIGEIFNAIVTGAAWKGTWVRLLHPPVERRLVSGFEGLDVGQRIRVALLQTDVEHGFIDFKRIG